MEATDDILEHAAFIADETDVHQNVLYKETVNFLQCYPIPYAYKVEGGIDHRMAVISLSGGKKFLNFYKQPMIIFFPFYYSL